MGVSTNWDGAYQVVLSWAVHNANPGVVHTLWLTNHKLGPRYELRICVRDAAGCILVASRGRRRTKYLPPSVEQFIIRNLALALGLPSLQHYCRIDSEPRAEKPTFPVWRDDPISWQTETLPPCQDSEC